MNYKAVIFDMDGVLVDSMLHWLETDRRFLVSKGRFDEDLFKESIIYGSGRHENEIMIWWKEKFDLLGTVGELMKERKVGMDDVYTNRSKVMPGVVALLCSLKKSAIKVAVATGAPYYCVSQITKRFGWEDNFCVTVSADHVGRVGKPDPKIYLHTAEKLGVEPKDCVVIEDAENGVTAAKRAGMKCIAVPDPRWSFGDFSKADLIVKSLEDKKVYDFLGI